MLKFYAINSRQHGVVSNIIACHAVFFCKSTLPVHIDIICTFSLSKWCMYWIVDY